jgi:hypothetical protein
MKQKRDIDFEIFLLAAGVLTISFLFILAGIACGC